MNVVNQLLFILLALGSVSSQLLTAQESAAPDPPTQPEPKWGRLYLRRGLSPIQYFRDGFGGPIPRRELRLLFAENRLGCEPFTQEEQAAITRVNGSVAVVVDRGVCTFETKSRVAEQMGATALIIISEDESAKAPVATVLQGEISIASVMIRRSGGALLREVASRAPVFAQLIPIVCEGKPYACDAQSAAESKYIESSHARSGVIFGHQDGATVGEFLAATYGSVLPLQPLSLTTEVTTLHGGCEEIPSGVVSDKVVVLSHEQGECSDLQRVLNAQRASAALVLLNVGDNPSSMTHPTLPQAWQGYNITIPVAAISSSTAATLTELAERGGTIQLEQRNAIADAWKEVRGLSVRTAWPTRKDRKHKTLQRLLNTFSLDPAQLRELKTNFLLSGGGSRDDWDKLTGAEVAEDEGDEARDAEYHEVAVDVQGV